MFDLNNANNGIICSPDAAAVSLSLSGVLPDFRNGMISIMPEALDAGRCFYVRSLSNSIFSFTNAAESIIKTLCLTIRNTFYSYRRKVKRTVTLLYKRAKIAVRSTVPRFMRL